MAHTQDHWGEGVGHSTHANSVLWRTVRNALVVVAMCVVVAAGFRYRAEFFGVTDLAAPRSSGAGPAPTSPAARGDREIGLRMAANGHFLAGATVNGDPVRFLVDTGASKVILTLADARRLGFDPDLLDFSERYRTAGGGVLGAPVVLREVRVGQLSLADVSASVTRGPLGVSLLGMSFLDRLEGYEVRRNRLILRW